MTETNGFCRSLLMGMMHERIIPMIDILPTHEVARELRCSKAHVSKAIAGKLPNVTPAAGDPNGSPQTGATERSYE